MNYFFPFAHRYNHLNQYWWHRLFSVLYWVVLFLTLIWFFWLNQSYQNSGYELCFRINLESNVEPVSRGCDVFMPHTLSNIGLAIIGTVIISYLLQIIYFKVFLYIVGKRKAS